MIDIHSHILYGVDDGAKTIDESVDIIRNLYKNGITDIILTPHYIEYSSYNSNKKSNLEKLDSLKKKLKEEGINVNLYLGNEIYINNNILSLLKKGEISSLNDSKYLLIELPMSGKYDNYVEIFKELIENGYKVILAHPERYNTFKKDINLIYELKNIGVLMQCNIESILKTYGKDSYKTIKKLAKNKSINFIASDIHHKKDYEYINKARNKFKKYYSDSEIDDLLSNNQKDIL